MDVSIHELYTDLDRLEVCHRFLEYSSEADGIDLSRNWYLLRDVIHESRHNVRCALHSQSSCLYAVDLRGVCTDSRGRETQRMDHRVE